MKKQVLSIFILGAFILSALGTAEAVTAVEPEDSPIYGAETYTQTIYAPSYYQTQGSSGDGGQDSLSALSTYSDTNGSAEAASGIGFNTSLKAKAAHNSGADYGAIATARAIQGYTYTGTGSTSLTLNAALTGSINDPAAIDNVYLTAQVFVYKTTNFSYCYDPGTLLYELGAELFYSGDSDNSTLDLGLFDTVTGGSDSGSLTLDLEEGQAFFVVSILRARASNNVGSWADAYSTLELSFNDISNLELGATATSSVPIPGAGWLMGSGLIGLVGFIRQRQRV